MSKVHLDRSFRDAISLDELQALASEAIAAPAPDDSQEMLHWLTALEGAEPGGASYVLDSLGTPQNWTLVTPSLPRLLPWTRCSQSGTQNPSPVLDAKVASHGLAAIANNHPDMPPLSSPLQVPEQNRKCSISAQNGKAAGKRSAGDIPPSRRRRGAKRLRAAEVSSEPYVLDTTTSSSCSFSPLPHPHPRERIPLGESDGNSQSSPPLPSPPLVSDALCPPPPPPPPPGNQLCKYSGSRCCPFATRRVLVSPHLAASPHPASRALAAHGIPFSADVQDWALALAAEPRRRGVCLVDAAIAASALVAAAAALASVTGSATNDAPRRRRRVVAAAYDWRVLESVARAESADGADRRMDGFSDPWRRWFVGYV